MSLCRNGHDRDFAGRDRLGRCRACVAAVSRRYAETHREQELERKRVYYETHREEELERAGAYYKTHREQKLERRRLYYQAHREQEIEYARLYHASSAGFRRQLRQELKRLDERVESSVAQLDPRLQELFA